MMKQARLGTLLVLAVLAAACSGTGPEPSPAHPEPMHPPSDTPAAARFPLSASSNGRYLVDSTGKPFLLHGDTAWSLIVDLSREDAERYLQDRAARGFNTLLVNLIDHQFARHAPRNYYGAAPFMRPGDFSAPNEPYFAHADYVLQRAHDLGFVVLLVPAYLGYEGGSQGWYQELAASDSTALLAYGRFLGQRYRAFDNIIWTHGGDYNPPNREVVRRIAEGIREFDSDALTTSHNAPESAAVDYWGGEPWLTLNNVYTYGPVYSAAWAQYGRNAAMPFFLLESAYEHEQNSTTVRLRTQAYHALLSGAAGHIFGNNPIWHFDGPGIYSAPVTWQQALDGPGTRSMQHLKALFDTLPWWTLVPDTQGRLILEGAGNAQDRAVAAYSADGALAVAYIPSLRDITFDLRALAGPRVSATWYDPAAGIRTPDAGSPFIATAVQKLHPPHDNSESSGDWVLILESAP